MQTCCGVHAFRTQDWASHGKKHNEFLKTRKHNEFLVNFKPFLVFFVPIATIYWASHAITISEKQSTSKSTNIYSSKL
jgi:hypothetical protein